MSRITNQGGSGGGPTIEAQCRQADLAAWAADAEAERAALMATPEAALSALGLGRSDIIARAKALRIRARRPHA